MSNAVSDLASITHTGELARVMTFFARLLRSAGFSVGVDHATLATRAVSSGGLDSQRDFYFALQAVFVSSAEQTHLFPGIFALFWSREALALTNPETTDPGELPPLDLPMSRDNSLGVDSRDGTGEPESPISDAEPEHDGDGLNWSAREVLAGKDFAKMDEQELRLARRLLQRMEWHQLPVSTRRLRADTHGQVFNKRASLRRSLRGGLSGTDLVWSSRRMRLGPLCIICDVSGSMSAYSRMLLHFCHRWTKYIDC